MTERKNPYQRLLEKAMEFARKVKYAHRITMWTYPKSKLSDSWKLSDLFERTYAADQLGYDVQIIAKDEGLIVRYVKRVEIPYGWAP